MAVNLCLYEILLFLYMMYLVCVCMSACKKNEYKVQSLEPSVLFKISTYFISLIVIEI